MKQSIPLPNAQRSIVDTGNTEELKDNVLNEQFKYPKGKVKKITERKNCRRNHVGSLYCIRKAYASSSS